MASGAIVIATSSSNEKLKVAERLGAKHLINYKETPDWDKEVERIVRSFPFLLRIGSDRRWVQTGGVGVDHIVDVGGPGTIHKSFNAVRNGGQISVIGFLWTGPVRHPPWSLPRRAALLIFRLALGRTQS